jgi:hypothetical protein
MIDGASGMELAQVMYDFEPDPTPPEARHKKTSSNRRGSCSYITKRFKTISAR